MGNFRKWRTTFVLFVRCKLYCIENRLDTWRTQHKSYDFHNLRRRQNYLRVHYDKTIKKHKHMQNCGFIWETFKKYNMFGNRHLKIETREKFIKTFVWTVWSYCSETWTTPQYDKKLWLAIDIWMWNKMIRTRWKSNEKILKKIEEIRSLMNNMKKK